MDLKLRWQTLRWHGQLFWSFTITFQHSISMALIIVLKVIFFESGDFGTRMLVGSYSSKTLSVFIIIDKYFPVSWITLSIFHSIHGTNITFSIIANLPSFFLITVLSNPSICKVLLSTNLTLFFLVRSKLVNLKFWKFFIGR